jgi:hypothetical protein
VIDDDRGLNPSFQAELVVIDLEDVDGAAVGKPDGVALAGPWVLGVLVGSGIRALSRRRALPFRE